MGRAALIVDTSALVAILLDEPEAVAFTIAIRSAGRTRLSTSSYIEASLRLGREADCVALAALDPLIERLGISLEPLTVEHALAAREAGARFGKGHHPAKLNFGDCCAYALAKVSGEPLLFKGNDFSQTDIAVALPL